MLLHFADAEDDFKSSKFIIFGVPYDGTSSYRYGSRFAPDEIRKASYNFESFVFTHNLSLSDVKIHDMGNLGTLDEFGDPEKVVETVHSTMGSILPEKFPIMLGGEHSVTVGAARALKKMNAGIIFIDAHADFRDQYLGKKFSHACTARRSFEILNGKVFTIGVRSISKEEREEADKLGYNFIDAFKFREIGWKEAIETAKESIGTERIYLSIDIDGIDPAYAPGTGTPEPFGLEPVDVKNIINFLAPYLVGADITEVSPPYDNGNTSALAARLVQEIVAAVVETKKDKFI
jgi:agmatinase